MSGITGSLCKALFHVFGFSVWSGFLPSLAPCSIFSNFSVSGGFTSSFLSSSFLSFFFFLLKLLGSTSGAGWHTFSQSCRSLLCFLLTWLLSVVRDSLRKLQEEQYLGRSPVCCRWCINSEEGFWNIILHTGHLKVFLGLPRVLLVWIEKKKGCYYGEDMIVKKKFNGAWKLLEECIHRFLKNTQMEKRVHSLKLRFLLFFQNTW